MRSNRIVDVCLYMHVCKGAREQMKSVFVIGHRNPDTDSICSAICYAHLKQILTGQEHIACRAGQINPETKFVLDHFKVEPPRYLASLNVMYPVSVQICPCAAHGNT